MNIPREFAFVKKHLKGLPPVSGESNPFSLLSEVKDHFEAAMVEARRRGDKRLEEKEKYVLATRHYVEKKEKDGKIKIRHIGAPNLCMKILQRLFIQFIQEVVKKNLLGSAEKSFSDSKRMLLQVLVSLPSSKAFVAGAGVYHNVKEHKNNKYFYILDIKDAYDSVDLEMLATIIVCILKWDIHASYFDEFSRKIMKFGVYDKSILEHITHLDPLTPWVLCFLRLFCAGKPGGLVTGGVCSPYLFNLYCEVLLDRSFRYYGKSRDGEWRLTYTRYADDLTFSSHKFLSTETRQEIRKRINSAGLLVNHKKFFVLSTFQGTVFVTKVGLNVDVKLSFPQWKRRRLHGLIRQYLYGGNVTADFVAGHIAHYKEHLKHQHPNKSDELTLLLCKEFSLSRKRVANFRRT